MLTQSPLRAVPAAQSSKTVFDRVIPGRDGLGAIELMGTQMTFGANEEIYGEDEPAEFVYKLVSGAVRTYKILSDGRRQIGAFYSARRCLWP